MLTRLGELLRLTLRAETTHVTSLREELATLGAYLDIMKVRFADRITVRLTVPAHLESARVPRLLLQPLVENALEHGVGRLDGGGEVEIEAAQDRDDLLLSVRDNGAGTPGQNGHGVGIANSRARLSTLYGGRAGISLLPRATGGMEAVVRLPLLLDPA